LVVSVNPEVEGGSGYRHEALLYSGPEEFVDACTEVIRDGVAAGEATLVVVTGPKVDALRSALGAVPDGVTFADMSEVGRNPGRIIWFWRTFVAAHASAGRPVRGIGEPVHANLSAPFLAECQLHESLLNVAFDGTPPFWLLCPYDVETLSADVIDAARRSHPHVAHRGGQHGATSYEPVDLAAPFDRPLPPPPPGAAVLEFAACDLKDLRAFVADRAREGGVRGVRVADLVLAVHELATNSVAHGGGSGTARAWRTADALVVEVADCGHLASPLAGRLRPTLTGLRGRGLWMANQLCDLVQIRSSAGGGTVVRVQLRF
jgi:anti-sigma regulatory factor (Ser/Thr protein kinase)